MTFIQHDSFSIIPKGYEPWKNDFAHVQYITSEDGGGVDGKKSGQDCGGYSVATEQYY